MYKTILVAIDLDSKCEKVLKKAISMAKYSNADLIIAHIAQIAIIDPTFESGLTSVMIPDDNQEVINSLESYVKLAKNSGIKNVNYLNINSSNVAYTLTHDVYESEAYDLIVCGSSNRHGIEQFILGSTSTSIAKGSKTDVYIVKDKLNQQ